MACDVDVSIFVRTLIKCVSCDRQGCSGCVFLAITEATHDVCGSCAAHRVHTSRPYFASILRVIVFTKICRRHHRVASTNN